LHFLPYITILRRLEKVRGNRLTFHYLSSTDHDNYRCRLGSKYKLCEVLLKTVTMSETSPSLQCTHPQFWPRQLSHLSLYRSFRSENLKEFGSIKQSGNFSVLHIINSFSFCRNVEWRHFSIFFSIAFFTNFQLHSYTTSVFKKVQQVQGFMLK
jgi:hypothetical protein